MNYIPTRTHDKDIMGVVSLDLKGQFSYLYIQSGPYVQYGIPKLTPSQALVVGAVSAILKNPLVTRRFWEG